MPAGSSSPQGGDPRRSTPSTWFRQRNQPESRAYSALSDPSFFGVAHWGTDAFYCGLEPEEGRGQRSGRWSTWERAVTPEVHGDGEAYPPADSNCYRRAAKGVDSRSEADDPFLSQAAPARSPACGGPMANVRGRRRKFGNPPRRPEPRGPVHVRRLPRLSGSALPVIARAAARGLLAPPSPVSP